MSLFLDLKGKIIQKVIDGTYKVGEVLPTEHELAGEHQLSRVTVRKALEELKSEGLLAGVPRQGTMVLERMGGYRSSLDIIALVATVQETFFATFMEHFERTAEDNGSLMLFKQDFQGKAFYSEAFFFRLVQKNIRNVVLWPQTVQIDFELLRRLHSVGMNFVFFDQMFDTDVADTVCLDNDKAVTALFDYLVEESGSDSNLLFIGFEGLSLPSAVQREEAFIQASRRTDAIRNIPWGLPIDQQVALLLDCIEKETVRPAGFLCNSGGIGLEMARQLRLRNLEGSLLLGTIDYLPEMDAYPMAAYRQPFELMAEKTYQRLIAQNNQGQSWRAGAYQVEGQLIKCGAKT
ncbi:GntR family transcriptional regulator [Paenibacillus nasutitermitis]|nr:GntR family transcriptional regulator [Paenibacillus nasutitermitis]